MSQQPTFHLEWFESVPATKVHAVLRLRGRWETGERKLATAPHLLADRGGRVRRFAPLEPAEALISPSGDEPWGAAFAVPIDTVDDQAATFLLEMPEGAPLTLPPPVEPAGHPAVGLDRRLRRSHAELQSFKAVIVALDAQLATVTSTWHELLGARARLQQLLERAQAAREAAQEAEEARAAARGARERADEAELRRRPEAGNSAGRVRQADLRAKKAARHATAARRKADALEARAGEAEERVRKLEERLAAERDDLAARLERASAEHSATAERHSPKVRSELEGRAEEPAEGRVEELETEPEKDAGDRQREIEETRAKADELEQALEIAHRREGDAIAGRERLANRVGELERELIEAREGSGESTPRRASEEPHLRRQLAEAEAVVAEARAAGDAVREREAERRAAMEAELDRLRQDYAKLRREVPDQARYAENLRTKPHPAAGRDELEDLRAARAQTERSVNTLHEERDAIIRRAEELSAERDAARALAEEHAVERHALERRVRELERQVETAAEQVSLARRDWAERERSSVDDS